MHLFYTDETNLNPGTSSDFFIYGGVVVPCDKAKGLSDRIEQIREDHGYKPSDLLKFTVHDKERPTHITPELHKQAKQAVITAAATNGAILLVSFIYHKLARDPQKARRYEINRVTFHFNCLLNAFKSSGLVLVDNFSDPELPILLREKFSVGLKGMPYGTKKDGILRLDRILGFHTSSLGTSHFASLVDILLGSLRFAINSREDENRQETVRTLLTQLSPLFYRDTGSNKVSELSLFFSPKAIKAPPFLLKYTELHAYLASHGIDGRQHPTDTISCY